MSQARQAPTRLTDDLVTRGIAPNQALSGYIRALTRLSPHPRPGQLVPYWQLTLPLGSVMSCPMLLPILGTSCQAPHTSHSEANCLGHNGLFRLSYFPKIVTIYTGGFSETTLKPILKEFQGSRDQRMDINQTLDDFSDKTAQET